jgi:hypothetical protein
MDKLGWAILTTALIWAAVIFATADVLEATAYAPRVLRILVGGAAATIILLGGLTRGMRSKGSWK